MKFYIALFGLLAIAGVQSFDLKGHKVYRVQFSEDNQVRELYNEMFHNFERIFWLYVDPNQTYAEIVVAPGDVEQFVALLGELSLKYEFLFEIKDKGQAPAAATFAAADRTSYDGYKVYKIKFTTEEQFETVRQLQMQPSNGISVWQLCHARMEADIMVSPEKLSELLSFFKTHDFKYECVIEDLGELIPGKSSLFKDYKGFKVYEVHFTTEEQFKILQTLQVNSNGDEISVLQLSHLRKSADIMTSPKTLAKLLELLDRYNFTYKCVVEDVEAESSDVARSEKKVSYKGYKLYKVTFETKEQFQYLYEMMLLSGTQDGYSVWRLSRADKSADILVAPSYLPDFMSLMSSHSFGIELLNDDIEG